MGMVTIRCPKTGSEASIGLEIDRVSWAALPVIVSMMRCPVCGGDHYWSKLEAQFIERPRPWAETEIKPEFPAAA